MAKPRRRRFNTAGPNDPRDCYTLPALRRLANIRDLIDQKLYFVIHAPRQVGKTTAILTLAKELTEGGEYAAMVVSAETGAGLRQDVGAAELTMLDVWRAKARIRLPADLQPPLWPDAKPGARILTALQAWAESSPRPLVLFIDEIDALEGDPLVSVLRQLRDGYADRPAHFPHSLALIGMRNVRDYKLAAGGADRSHSSSPFNIIAESLTLRNFTPDEVAELYAQHTAETGQVFTPEAIARAYELTNGQPWLVNALAREIVEDLAPEPAVSISVEHVDQAKDILVRRQDTHLDSLGERLQEPRVRRVIEPIMVGEHMGIFPEDDQRYVLDLGLVRESPTGKLEIANPIYREIIPRVLSRTALRSIPNIHPIWLKANGRMDFDALLQAFLEFWRRHGEPLLKSTPYHEAAPHLVLMAFLDRVSNGGGRVEREFAIGTGRMDLLLVRGPDQLPIEIKVWREDGDTDPLNDGLSQIDGYLDRLGLPTGWLVIFDRRSKAAPLAQRLQSSRATTPSGKGIVVIRA
jgi:hypothetical protein